MLYGVPLRWRFLSVFFDQFDGLGSQAWDIVPSTPTRDVLSGDFS